MFLSLNILQERAKKGEGEARSAGLEDESVGNAVSGRRRRQKSFKISLFKVSAADLEQVERGERVNRWGRA